jgi:uncharacterized protein (DUF427 family)
MTARGTCEKTIQNLLQKSDVLAKAGYRKNACHKEKITYNRSETDAMKLPGPDHPITIAHNTKRVRVTFAGKTVADTTQALTLKEASYPAVQYIPRADVKMDLLQATAHASHCPYKGDASYFSIVTDGKSAENAVWSYQQPFPAMSEIKDYLAFYPNRVDKIEEG